MDLGAGDGDVSLQAMSAGAKPLARGWVAVAASATTTLDYLMRDSVGHLQHHLRQIDRLRR
jgi:hypothetical protein